MDLSIIIVNYNARDFVIKCVQSLLENYKKEIAENKYEVIVIDNNSIDGSGASLKKNKTNHIYSKRRKFRFFQGK